MKKTKFAALASASLLFLTSLHAATTTITEDFSSDPAQNGWQTFGNSNLFQWDGSNHDLQATWDSTQPNTYFYHPLGATLTRVDDFQLDFDFVLFDVASGNETNKTGPLELGFGLYNAADAMSADFMRGAFGDAPSLVEFDYFPSGYYTFDGSTFPVNPTSAPAFIASEPFDFAPTIFAPYEFELPTNTEVHVSMKYSGITQTLTTSLSTNGVLYQQLPDVVLTDSSLSAFSEADDYGVNMISINSYSSAGDDFDSVLAHGTIKNLSVTYAQVIANYTATLSAGGWQAQVNTQSNWLYALQRTSDFLTWTNVAGPVAGTSATLTLADTNPPPTQSFYRISATIP